MKLEEMINKIILGDCYELIKNIPDKSIDCIYIDIPYLFESGGVSDTPLSKRIKKQMNSVLENIRKGIDYEIFKDFRKIMKFTNIFIWCSKNQIIDILNYWKDDDVNYEILTWNKSNPTPQTNGTWLPDIEYCLYFREKGEKLNDGYELKSKWYTSPINKNDKDLFNHPTIKPLELVKRHLLHTTQENDIILDFFCGSGTTCVGAKELNRQFIGIEIDPEYHKIATNRLNGILANGQQTIFTDFNQTELF